MTRFYEVLVSNIGAVHKGINPVDAGIVYAKYVRMSASNTGRAVGENVTLWCDGEIIREHEGTVTESN
jgi:hypothetical protein